MPLGWFRGSIAATLMSLIPGCEYAEWNQKMTVVVATPEGERSGSSVINVWFSTWDTFFTLGKIPSAEIEGEAVVVDMGPRGTLLALLSSDYTLNVSQDRIALYTLSDQSSKPFEIDDAIARVLNRPKGESFVVDQRYYPMLVAYRDPADPTTIEFVDPNDLAATFGAGVRLERITLETTDEPVSPSRLKGLMPCYTTGAYCSRVPRDTPYGDPLTLVPNEAFWSTN